VATLVQKSALSCPRGDEGGRTEYGYTVRSSKTTGPAISRR